MRKVAKIENGKIVNIAVVGDDIPDFLNSWILVTETEAIGDNYDGLVFSKPLPPAPSSDPRDHPLSPEQWIELSALHGYDDAIDAMLSGLRSRGKRRAKLKRQVLYANNTKWHFDFVLDLLNNPTLRRFTIPPLNVDEASLTERWLIAKDT